MGAHEKGEKRRRSHEVGSCCLRWMAVWGVWRGINVGFCPSVEGSDEEAQGKKGWEVYMKRANRRIANGTFELPAWAVQ